MARFFFYIAAVALLLMPAGALAQEEIPPGGAAAQEIIEGEDVPQDDSSAQEELAELPPMHYVLAPEFSGYLGANVVEVDGSRRAIEYGWPYSSVAGGFGIHHAPLPNRYSMELDWLNQNDYFANLSYAYKDIMKLDYLGLALWHNLDHFRPRNDNGTPVDDRNPTAEYGVSARDNRVNLRLKWPDKAYHAFAEFREFEREGTVQQRYIGRNLANTATTKISMSRDIEWITRSYLFGANGHFGPVEAEYSHRIKDFRPHEDVELFDQLTAAARGLHNVVSKTEEHSDTLKLHTDLTGRVVASAVFVAGERRNRRTGAEVDYRRAGGDLVLMPLPGVTFSMKYSLKDTQADSPETRTDSLLGDVRPLDPVDKKTNRAEASLKYNPIRKLTLKAEYVYENVHREGAEAWSRRELPGQLILPYRWLPDDQNVHKVRLGFNSRLFKDANIRGMAEYVYNDDPAYSTEVRRAIKGKFNADYNLAAATTASAYYNFLRGNSESAATTIDDVVAGRSYRLTTPDLDVEKDNAGVLLIYNPLERLSLSAGYDWMRLRNESNVEFLRPAPREVATLVDRIAYRDSAHAYHLGAAYAFVFPLSVEAEFHQSHSRGRFRTADLTSGANSTTGIGELTDMKIRETGGELTARYDFPKGWGASATYSINDYEDLEDKPQDGLQDGTAHTIMVMVSKKWF